MQQRIPVITSIEIEEFAGGVVTVPQALVTNGIFMPRANGEMYVTQRPSINIAIDASAVVSDVRGRGIFYWTIKDKLYFVNDNKVYYGDYTAEVVEAAVTVSDVTGVAGTATVTTAAPHGYKTDDKITIAGTTSYNGEYVIIKTGASAFTFAHAATTSEPGSATRRLGGGGHDRVYFLEIGSYLVILDPEDNAGWYIIDSNPQVLVEITGAGFPSHINSLALARGGAVLDGTLYVMDTLGTIANSDIEDPTTWDVLGFIEAEVEKDGGVMLAKHNNHLVAFGNRTIEYFYDAANPAPASPLSVRQDVSHEIGMAAFDSVWSSNNELFFVAQARTGSLGVYRMRSFTVEEISPPVLDTLLTSAVNTDGLEFFGSGFTAGNDSYYVLTIYQLNTDAESLESFVFNSRTSTWTRFELMHSGIDDCPIMDFTVANATQLGKGILINGDIVTIADDLAPQDSVLAQGGVFEDDPPVFELGVFTNASPGYGTDISMEIITGQSDHQTINRKFMSSLRLVGPKTSASQTMTVEWSNESNSAYNTFSTIDTSIPGRRIPRLGSYRQRNFKLTYAGSERIELDALEAEVNAGKY